MGGGGGATSNIDQNLTFEDTSEYMYKNSSRYTAGFEFDAGVVNTNTDIGVSGTEDVVRDQELLRDADQDDLRSMIASLTSCTTDQLCDDKADLKDRAGQAWDRAWNLYPTYKEQLDAELDELREDTIEYICLWEQQWARTAGSSLNCLVQSMKNRAEVELARKLAGVIAESNRRMKEHETQAIAQAFTDNLNARMEPNKLALGQIGALWGVLRGATVKDITDRDYTENRNEDTLQLTAMGKYYREAEDWSENEGTYLAEVNELAGLADAAAAG